jgi:hypothetical protein
MFNKNGFKTIGDNIYVYNNFVTEQECNQILSLIKTFQEDKWMGRFSIDGEGHKWYDFSVDLLVPIKKRIENILDDKIYLGDNLSIIRMLKGQSWGLHSDDHDYKEIVKASKNLKEGEEFELRQNIVMGLILYFNEFEGGDLYYPIQNVGYQPKKGDLVIHGPDKNCQHKVNKLISDVRYSHSNHLYEIIKVPKGTPGEPAHYFNESDIDNVI